MTRGFSIGGYPQAKPMASMGGSQFFPNYRSATTMPAMSSSYRGPGLGTMKPMLSATQKFAVNYKGSKNYLRLINVIPIVVLSPIIFQTVFFISNNQIIIT